MPELCGAQGDSERERKQDPVSLYPLILSKSLPLPTFLLTVVVSRSEVSAKVENGATLTLVIKRTREKTLKT